MYIICQLTGRVDEGVAIVDEGNAYCVDEGVAIDDEDSFICVGSQPDPVFEDGVMDGPVSAKAV